MTGAGGTHVIDYLLPGTFAAELRASALVYAMRVWPNFMPPQRIDTFYLTFL
ncbi:hypothetical protein HHL24_27490 [Paraburkholderia sp. RP-4-7]|jgi:hypothetical protein|uniref:Uncharacterized protein n=1 Tax=Paraburkholderia polaris TaxID=2728848 RepID=A0A848IK56_9BURK|nr:hypothetical protein [Paraburkholderia polaris]NMM01670.1 hypothetical protein [Paraburkholderia polaris]